MRWLSALLAAGAALLASELRAETWPAPSSELDRWRRGSEAERIQAAIAAAGSAPKVREAVWAELVADPSPEVRTKVLESAGSLASDELQSRLAELALDSDENVSIAALSWLRGASEGALPVLSRALFSGNGAVREGAALALGELRGGADATREGLLIGALRDSEPKVRAQAARSLGASAQERALPSLSLLLRDPDPSVREQASRALAAVGGETAAGFLRQVVGEFSSRGGQELLPGYLETRDGGDDLTTARLLLAVLRDAESHTGFAALARSWPGPWLARLFELSSSASGRQQVRRLLQTVELEPSRSIEALLEARARECIEREAEFLCHSWALGLLPDAVPKRVAAYRAGRLTALEAFEGVLLSEAPELRGLALELFEGRDVDARRAALRALERGEAGLDDVFEPLALLLQRPDLALDEIIIGLRLLGRTQAPKARRLLELYEESTLASVRNAAAEARLEQLLGDSEPDCGELSERLRKRNRAWIAHPGAKLSGSAVDCLLSAIEGRPTAERHALETLLVDARFNEASLSRDQSESLAARAFSLSRRARGAERSLLVQLALRLGTPEEALSLAREARLEASSQAQLVSALHARADVRALTLQGAFGASLALPELITQLDAPSRLHRVAARLGLRRAVLAGAATDAERSQAAERACADLRGRDVLSVVSAIALVSALGPSGVGESCWSDATVRSYMAPELPLRMAAVLVARSWPDERATARVLRLCRLHEQEVGLARWCAEAPRQERAGDAAANSEAGPRLISRRMSGAPRTGGAFLSFIAESGALRGIELELIDPSGRHLVLEGRETVLALPF